MGKFKQPKLNSKCKVCKLLKTQAKLFHEIHERVLEDHISQAKVCQWTNIQLSFINASLPEGEEPYGELNATNFHTHFKNHIGATAKAAQAMHKKIVGREVVEGGNYTPEEKSVVEGFLHEMSAELSDYLDFTKMIATLEESLWKYNEETLTATYGNGKPKKVNLNQLKTFMGMLDKLADMKIKLTNLRNQGPVAGNAVKRGVSLAVEVFITQLIAATDESMATFKEAYPEATIGDEIVETLRNKLGSEIKAALKEIIDTTFKEFHIR